MWQAAERRRLFCRPADAVLRLREADDGAAAGADRAEHSPTASSLSSAQSFAAGTQAHAADYERISEQLFRALIEAICALANSTFDG